MSTVSFASRWKSLHGLKILGWTSAALVVVTGLFWLGYTASQAQASWVFLSITIGCAVTWLGRRMVYRAAQRIWTMRQVAEDQLRSLLLERAGERERAVANELAWVQELLGGITAKVQLVLESDDTLTPDAIGVGTGDPANDFRNATAYGHALLSKVDDLDRKFDEVTRKSGRNQWLFFLAGVALSVPLGLLVNWLSG